MASQVGELQQQLIYLQGELAIKTSQIKQLTSIFDEYQLQSSQLQDMQEKQIKLLQGQLDKVQKENLTLLQERNDAIQLASETNQIRKKISTLLSINDLNQIAQMTNQEQSNNQLLERCEFLTKQVQVQDDLVLQLTAQIGKNRKTLQEQQQKFDEFMLNFDNFRNVTMKEMMSEMENKITENQRLKIEVEKNNELIQSLQVVIEQKGEPGLEQLTQMLEINNGNQKLISQQEEQIKILTNGIGEFRQAYSELHMAEKQVLELKVNELEQKLKLKEMEIELKTAQLQLVKKQD